MKNIRIRNNEKKIDHFVAYLLHNIFMTFINIKNKGFNRVGETDSDSLELEKKFEFLSKQCLLAVREYKKKIRLCFCKTISLCTSRLCFLQNDLALYVSALLFCKTITLFFLIFLTHLSQFTFFFTV